MDTSLSSEERIRRCLLIEKMNKDKEYSEKLGLENKSILYGITNPENIRRNDSLEEKDIK